MQKQVIVVCDKLGMSPGKLIAQAVHAVLRTPLTQTYKRPLEHTCIVYKVSSETKLITLAGKASEAGIPYGLQRDAGKTEVEEGTFTALSLGPVDEDQLDVLNALTKRLQLLTGS